MPRAEKTRIAGLQTAVVCGSDTDEDIAVDKYGRVQVTFHWNKPDKKDAKSSCPVRVASPWAGKSWGAVSIPRVGQEVVVSFLEGDPDRPLIIGSVYNADNMPPYALAGQQDPVRHQVAQPARRRATTPTNCASRTRRAPSKSSSMRRRTCSKRSRTTTPSPSTTTRK